MYNFRQRRVLLLEARVDQSDINHVARTTRVFGKWKFRREQIKELNLIVQVIIDYYPNRLRVYSLGRA
jgi:hypothetical protein